MRTLAQRAATYARRHPGLTATTIANALHAKPASVSSALHKEWRRGRLARCVWLGFGDRFTGHRYGPQGTPWWDAVTARANATR
jgi:hypothetical protein